MFKDKLGRAFHSRVARRIGLAFILSATLPLAGLALLTMVRTRAELETQARDDLRADVKSAANDGLGRLSLFAEKLKLAGVILASAAPSTEADVRALALFERSPRLLAVFAPPNRLRTIPESGPAFTLTDSQRHHLEQTGSLLIEAPPSVGTSHLLVVAIESHGLPGMVAASVDESALFGLDDGAFLPAATSLCVFDASELLACSPSAPLTIVREAAALSRDHDGMVDGGSGYLTHVRFLPLEAIYGVDPWRLVMTRSLDTVREPVRRFTQDFLLVALLSTFIVAWVSLSQIRKQLRPLDVLMEATERLKRRDFRPTAVLQSADEFQELGEAFNSLSAQLARQFADLEAFSLGTLDTLARAIDAKSPWTAGHSDRVTTMAVAIGRAMSLTDEEVMDLRCGGPVHDIGKLATPPEVLDKPGPLTPEEFEVMRQHTTKGVHILQPIAAFQRLLAIVGQHHERWDGGGYPIGLKGTEIDRTARVLAVADVFDAMRSDRPYRPGMAEDDVVRGISAGAGSHFDPEVVAAFLNVMGPRRGSRDATAGRQSRIWESERC